MAHNYKVDIKNERQNARPEILKSASALFIEKGYLKTTVREIAERSRLSIGGLYYHIQSKEDLLNWFYDNESLSAATMAEIINKKLSESNCKDVLREALRLLLLRINEIQDHILFTYRETGNLPPEIREKVIKFDLLLVDLFKNIIEAGTRWGDFKVADLDLAAHDIIVLVDMWAFRRWALRGHLSLEQFIDYQTNFIIAGLSYGML
jgi:TetR/AcrR family transcriptional regulator, cholesterol catabolism regulator